MNITDKINCIEWSEYETAYSGTGEKIAGYLEDLFSDDNKKVMAATHMLWCSLCHQHAYVSSAALPAYDFLKYALIHLSDLIKIEMLDIFTGFAVCTNDTSISLRNETPAMWELELKKKLNEDLALFESFKDHKDEDISDFAQRICKYILDLKD